MAAHQHGVEIVLDAGTPGEHVAHLVDLERAALLLAPGAEQLAALLVEVGEGEALAPALRRGPDLGHLHQRVPKALTIDSHIREIGHSEAPPSSQRSDAIINLTKRSNAAKLDSGARKPGA